MNSPRCIFPAFILAVIFINYSINGGEKKNETILEEAFSSYVKPSPRIINPALGLNVHTRYSPREIPVISNSGVRFIRFHYTWKEVEKQKGRYELPETALNFMKELRKTKLEPLMILAYGNPLYNKKGSKQGFGEHKGQDQVFADAFGRYCSWMVKNFGSKGNKQVKYWEIWNEQNEASPEDFIPVLKAASESIRANDPDAYIIFGGISRVDYAFLKKCLELGAANYVDAIAYHPYREGTFPEDTYQSGRRFNGRTHCYANEVIELRKLIKGFSKNKKEIPLWITEFGYWTTDSENHLNRKFSVSHDVQAKYLIRSIIQNMALGIDKYFIYRAVDSSFFGITYGPKYLPRPAYFALQYFLSQFPQGSPVEVLDCDISITLKKCSKEAFRKKFGNFDPHAYAFKTNNDTVLLFFWNSGVAKDAYADSCMALVNMEISLPVKDKELCQYDIFYGSCSKSYNNGEWKSPVIKLNKKYRIESLKYYDSPVMLKLTLQK